MDVDNGERITLDSEADLDNGLFPGATVEDDGCKTISASGVTDEAIDEDLDENGVFMRMTKILQERGLTNEAKLKAECKNFKCPQAPNAASTVSYTTSQIFLIRNQHWRFCATVKDLKCFSCQNFTVS